MERHRYHLHPWPMLRSAQDADGDIGGGHGPHHPVKGRGKAGTVPGASVEGSNECQCGHGA